MNQLNLKLGSKTRRVSLQNCHDPNTLAQILKSTFKIKEQVIGVTDEYGKFYHLAFVNDNIAFLKPHTLSLVTVKQNEDNMSFASQNGEQQYAQNHHNPTYFDQFPNVQGFLGFIYDLPIFEEILLRDRTLTIVICSGIQKAQLELPFNFYVLSSNKNSVIIYFGFRKIGEMYIQNWNKLVQQINPMIKGMGEEEDNKHSSGNEEHEEGEEISEKHSNNDNDMPSEEIKCTFLQNLVKLREEETISELQFYKLKSKLLENPEEFMRKYQMGTRQGLRKKRNIDELREEIVRSKEEKMRYQTIINQFKGADTLGREHRNFKNQIPIIVRKYNNVIEKISTSYPLNIQQEQSINLIMELELKGLITEADARDYKFLILQEDPQVFILFSEYFEEMIDQIELSKKLKNKKSCDRQTLENKNKSEQILRMIIKHAKRNSFELLRNLAVQGNIYVVQCFEKFQNNKDFQSFSNNLEKIANYYRAKNSLEHNLESENMETI